MTRSSKTFRALHTAAIARRRATPKSACRCGVLGEGVLPEQHLVRDPPGGRAHGVALQAVVGVGREAESDGRSAVSTGQLQEARADPRFHVRGVDQHRAVGGQVLVEQAVLLTTAAGVTDWSPALPPLISRRSSSRHTTTSTGKRAATVDLPDVAGPTATKSVPGASSGALFSVFFIPEPFRCCTARRQRAAVRVALGVRVPDRLALCSGVVGLRAGVVPDVVADESA